RFGDESIGTILQTAGRSGNAVRAIQKVLKVDAATLSKQWREATELTFARQEDGVPSSPPGRAVITKANGGGTLNVGPALSPDGRRLLFLSERGLFSIDLYLADAETGRVQRRVIKQALDAHFESLEFINSAGAWDAAGRRFVFAAVRHGTPQLTIVDADRGAI